MEAWKDQLSRPDGMAMWIDEIVGSQAGDFVRRNPLLVAAVRTRMLAGIAESARRCRRNRSSTGRCPTDSEGSNMLDWSL